MKAVVLENRLVGGDVLKGGLILTFKKNKRPKKSQNSDLDLLKKDRLQKNRLL